METKGLENMHIYNKLIILVLSLSVLLSCSDGGKSPNPTEVVQTDKSTITLYWRYTLPEYDANGDLPFVVSGFRIYYGFESRQYTEMIDIGSANARQTTIYDLDTGKQYYFAATVYIERGIESRYSDELSLVIE